MTKERSLHSYTVIFTFLHEFLRSKLKTPEEMYRNEEKLSKNLINYEWRQGGRAVRTCVGN
jgi:hypothetical protein